MNTVEITAQNLGEKIKKGIVLLDFWAGWCAPCRMFGPIFEKAAEKHPDVVFGKVDTEAQHELASEFGIRSIPTVMAFKDGLAVFSQPGVLPGPALDRLIEKLRELDMAEVRKHVQQHAQQS